MRLVGKSLIVVGLLMFGFVAYQLWGTGIEYSRAQGQAEDEFAALLEHAATGPTATIAAPSTTAVATAPATSPPGTMAAATTTTATTTTMAATTTTIAPTTTVAVVDIAALGITDGEGFARLQIPRIGLDDTVVAGVGREDLKKGPGHYPQTPLPGQLGNAAIAGHRTTYGGPFLHIDELEAGDEIIVETPQGRFLYRTTTTEIVDADDWQVIATTDPTMASLTLTSCDPVGTASRRIIVHAELDIAQSDAPAPAVFNYGRDAAATATGDLPGEAGAAADTSGATTTPSTAVTATTLGATSTESTSEAGTTATTATTATTVASSTTTVAAPPPTLDADALYSVVPGGGTIGGDDGGDGDAAEDAFANAWFSDSGAWPQVALWASAAGLVAVAGYLVARRLRNSWIGSLPPPHRSSSPSTSSTRTSTACSPPPSRATLNSHRVCTASKPRLHTHCANSASLVGQRVWGRVPGGVLGGGPVGGLAEQVGVSGG